jgi:hypothetical protein
MVTGYPGVSRKYFDNRETEVATLNDLGNTNNKLIKTSVSWTEYEIVKYRMKA